MNWLNDFLEGIWEDWPDPGAFEKEWSVRDGKNSMSA